MNRMQKIIAKRKRGGHNPQYLVKWQGWTVQFSTWQFKKHHPNIQSFIDEFQIQQKKEQSFFKTRRVNNDVSEDSQHSMEINQQIPFKIYDERTSKKSVVSGETFEIIERKEEQSDVKFLIKKKFTNHWVEKYYLMKKYPEKLCKFYEDVYLDPKRKLKWLKNVQDDIN